MDTESWILAGLAAVGLMVATLVAAAEMALASMNRLRLRELTATQPSRARVAEALLAEPAQFLSTLFAVKILTYVTVASSVSLLVLRLRGSGWLVWGLLAVALALIFAQLLARAWTLDRQERVALRLARPVRLLTLALWPLTALMRQVGRRALPDDMAPESIFLSEDGLRFLLNVTEEETNIEEDEKEMIASVFAFGDKLVREVMVPRIDVTAVAVDLPLLTALDMILKAGHSRIPVYKDSIDNIVGILYAKDLLRYLRDGRTDVPLTRILRPAYFIPESKKVDELLGELQQRKVHMAVVVDEYGGTAGIVTIEDLLEEIVGEIQDEFDAEEPAVEEVAAGEYLFDARVSLGETSKLLDVELPDEGGDTLGGFIYSQLGKVPAVGDTIEYGPVRIEVLSVAGRRIKQVRASIWPVEEPTEVDENSRESASLGLLTFLALG